MMRTWKKFHDNGHDNSLNLDCIAMLLFNNSAETLVKTSGAPRHGQRIRGRILYFIFFIHKRSIWSLQILIKTE